MADRYIRIRAKHRIREAITDVVSDPHILRKLDCKLLEMIELHYDERPGSGLDG